MSYERNFYNQFKQLSNPSSSYYGKAYENLRKTLNASTPTTSSLLGIQMAMGGSYKGSLAAAQKQRRAIETRSADRALQGTNQLYASSQGQALNALQGAEQARQYEDSQPGFFDYLASPISTLAGNYLGGLLGVGQQQQQQNNIPWSMLQFNQQNGLKFADPYSKPLYQRQQGMA